MLGLRVSQTAESERCGCRLIVIVKKSRQGTKHDTAPSGKSVIDPRSLDSRNSPTGKIVVFSNEPPYQWGERAFPEGSEHGSHFKMFLEILLLF